MKKLFEKPTYEITAAEHLEGRTLCAIYQFEPKEKDTGLVYMPHDAEFELCFMLCNR